MDIRLSYTAVSAFEKCPLSYRYQYIDGIEVEPSPYLSFGRSLHAALEWMYGRDVPEPPTLEEFLSYLDSCWEREGYSDPEEERHFLNHARDVLTQFLKANVGDFRLPVAVEERFEMDMGGFILRGVIDRVDRHTDGSYEIIDYKTSRRLPELHRLRGDLQLPIYQIAYRETRGISPSKLTYYYLIANQKYTTKPYNQQGLVLVKERLNEIAKRINSGEFPATPNRLCPWCSYEDICPQRGPGENQLERYIRRHQSLLQRKESLDRMIAELEEEMHQLEITLPSSDADICGPA